MIPRPPINDYGSYNQEAIQSGYRTHFNLPVFYRNTCIYCGNRYGYKIDNCKTCGHQ
jgi:rRNA maturation endonuclease Nob1